MQEIIHQAKLFWKTYFKTNKNLLIIVDLKNVMFQ